LISEGSNVLRELEDLQEGVSADAMAAFVYERMGGEFQLFDVLSETK
jgi:hypothetical protein